MGLWLQMPAEKYGISLYEDQETLKEIFSPVTPDFGSTKNPIDLTGQANAEYYERSLNAALNHDQIHAVLALYCEALIDSDELIRIIENSYRDYREKGKPLLFSLYGGEKIEATISPLRGKGLSVFSDVYNTVSCLGSLYFQARKSQLALEAPAHRDIDVQAIDKIIDNALSEGRTFLLTHEAHAVMRASNVTVPKTKIAKNLSEVVSAAKDMGYPLVMKIVSKDILHKSDAGGVALNLLNLEEVIDAYEAILHSCKSHYPNAVIEGVELAEMVEKSTETIIGARFDRIFGPVIMFGLGGIYVEVMKDVAFRSFPLSEREVREMIKETKAYPLLLGVRGEDKKDIDGVVDVIIKLGTIIRQCSRITDIEINPLVVYEQERGVKAVDVRILLSKAGGTSHG